MKLPGLRSLEDQRSLSSRNLEYHQNLIIYSFSHYQHFLKIPLKSVHNLLNYFVWTLRDATLGLVQVRITGHCTAAPHTASQSSMKVSPIVMKRLSHTLWPHWGKPSVTSEVTCLCGSNFMRHQRLSVQRQKTNNSSQDWQKENMQQRVVFHFQSVGSVLSETNVGAKCSSQLSEFIYLLTYKRNLHKHTPRLHNLNQSLKWDSAASYQPRSCHMIMSQSR